MTVERHYRCDGPDCDNNWSEAAAQQAPGLLTVAESCGYSEDTHLHFCSWDCVLKFAAKQEPTEIIRPEDLT